MGYIRQFEISDDHFQGFKVRLDMDHFDTNEAICDEVKRRLISFLGERDLFSLVNLAGKKRFHIHNHKFGALLLLPHEDTVWVCHHEHSGPEQAF